MKIDPYCQQQNSSPLKCTFQLGMLCIYITLMLLGVPLLVGENGDFQAPYAKILRKR